MFTDNTLGGQTASPRSSPGGGSAGPSTSWLSVLLSAEGAMGQACVCLWTEDPLPTVPHKPWGPERAGPASSHACSMLVYSMFEKGGDSEGLSPGWILSLAVFPAHCLLFLLLPWRWRRREKDTWQVSCKHLGPVCLSASLPPRHSKLLVDK